MLSFLISFLIVLREFQRAIDIAWRDEQFRALGFIMAILLVAGTIYYHQVEGWSWFDSLYFCVITLATVGYGDFSPHTVAGKAFTIFYVLLGIGVLVALLTRVADALLVARHEGKSTAAHRSFGLRRLGASPPPSEERPADETTAEKQE